MQRIRVKFCGITTDKDAQDAVSIGADALGFVFYKESPRYIRQDLAESIIKNIPPFVMIVGVFVNEDLEFVKDSVERCGLGAVQLHGDEDAAYCVELSTISGKAVRLIKAVRVKDKKSLSVLYGISKFHTTGGARGGAGTPSRGNSGAMRRIGALRSAIGAEPLWKLRGAERRVNLEGLPIDAILLDTYKPDLYGGTGDGFDHSIAVLAKDLGPPVIISGGLTPKNVYEVIRKVSPYAVDVSSGIESSPGKKDRGLMKQFMREVLKN